MSGENHQTPSDLLAAEAIRKEFRAGHQEHGVRQISEENFPLLKEVMEKEGEARRAAALVELRRLTDLVRPMLKPTKMTFSDFLAGGRPFGEADYQYDQAREALGVTIKTFRDQKVLSAEEIEENLK